jgi:hypothetical protein
MKKLFLLSLIAFTVNAKAQTWNSYNTTNGFQDITPSSITTFNSTGFTTYETTNGFQNITPSSISTFNSSGGLDTYNTSNGFKD